ncbi:hypothetical protein ACEWY4_007216 [Coilia grayii]|uniref:C2H2-type domain-containing protein n=1 Tax=Coilia grayii TaxID=363190 RepID=A0ABD1KFP1_9TELE
MTHVGFQTQIAGIIEELANAAVAEICKVVENGYAILHLEISQSRKQNDILKRKIQILEAERNYGSKCNQDRPLPINQICKITLKKPPRKKTRASGSPVNEGLEVQMDGTPGFNSEDRANSDHTGAVTEVLIVKEERISDTVNLEEPTPRDQSVDAQHSTTDMLQQMLECRNLECADIDKDEHIKNESLETYIKDDESSKFEESRAEYNRRAALSQTQDGAPVPNASTHDPVSHSSTFNPDHEMDSFNNFHPVNSVFHKADSSTSSYTIAADLPQEKLYHADGFRHATEMSRAPACREAESSLHAEMPSLSALSTTLEYTGTQQRQQKQWLVCRTCGKVCSSGSSLMEHQQTHSGQRGFICPLCGKSFSQASSLKKHQSIHTGEKPFRCSHCGKHFSDSSNLRKHVSIHTGERPFRCSQCGKTFNQSSNLKTHMKIHTGEKPFSCEGCGQVFAYKISLVNHQLKSCLGDPSLTEHMPLASKEKRLDCRV